MLVWLASSSLNIATSILVCSINEPATNWVLYTGDLLIIACLYGPIMVQMSTSLN